MRLQPQIGQPRVFRVVIVLFEFHARIRQMFDLYVETHLLGDRLHHVGQLQHGELLGELVEHTALAAAGGIQASQFDAANRVANIDKPRVCPPLP